LLTPLLALFSSIGYADTDVYLYDPVVASDVDVNTYQSSGKVLNHHGKPFSWNVSKGPAPAPFPTIAISENSFEQLGASNATIDGVIFINHGHYYVPGKKALILWIIRIPNASSRMANEFERDLTLSLFVDWNQDEAWKENERTMRKSLNLGHLFPTTHSKITVYYLSWFRVPSEADITALGGWHGRPDKDIRHMWARAVLAYDDPDMSADGAQLFGEYEDYFLTYFLPRGRGEREHGN
jgi:hypothetical protein